MRGEVRFERPTTAGLVGSVGARASHNPGWIEDPDAGFSYARKPKRRRYGKSGGSRRVLPRFLGIGLLAAYFGTISLFSFWQNGDFTRYVADNGPLYNIAARAVGLGINRVTINGIGRLRVEEVLAAAQVTPQGSLLFLDVTEMRERLETMPLVKSASVRKMYPNELILTLSERQPFAVWQKNGELAIVAEDGTVIDHTVDARFASLPLVVGENANLHIKQYLELLETAGPLKSRIRAGTYVAGRRWTLKMDSGIDIRLPETGTMEALKRLVALEQSERVLEKDVLAVDLRLPDRVVVRLSGDAATARAESMKKKSFYGVKGIQT